MFEHEGKFELELRCKITARRDRPGISWVHGFPSEVRQSTELPYEVVLQTGGGTWQLLMLRDAAMLMSRVEPYLLAGRMLHDPRIIGSPELKPSEGEFGPRRRRWPVRQDTVQATVWRSAAGNVCYAVANLSGKPVSVRLEATANGMAGPVQLTRIDPAGCQIMHEKSTLPAKIPLDLDPWQLCCLEQTFADH